MAKLDFQDIELNFFENDEFNINKKEIYIENFVKLKNKGLFKSNCLFEDKIWIQIIAGIEKKVIFPDQIKLYKIQKNLELEYSVDELAIAYRSFLLKQIFKKIDIYRIVNSINKIANGLNSFSKKDNEYLYDILDFIKYIKVREKVAMFIEETFNNCEDISSNSRMIPSFKSIFMFDKIINDIVNEKKIKLYSEYIPIILWWKITSILPLRPSEFLNIKFNCIFEKNNKYILCVQRSNSKSKRHIDNISKVEDYYREEKISISKELFDLIYKLKKYMKDSLLCDEEFLVSHYFLKEGFGPAAQRHLNKERFIARDLYVLLRRFYRKIVKNDYNYIPVSRYSKQCEGDIQILVPYDSRHIAIINLINLGYDVVTVMKLAGHDNISTTEGYYNHYESFTEAYSISYAKMLKKTCMTMENIENISSGDKALDTFEKTKNKNFIPIRVEKGYCTYSKVESDDSVCLANKIICEQCHYYISDNINKLEARIKETKDEIKSEVKVLRDIMRNRGYKFETKGFVQTQKIINKTKKLSFMRAKLKGE